MSAPSNATLAAAHALEAQLTWLNIRAGREESDEPPSWDEIERAAAVPAAADEHIADDAVRALMSRARLLRWGVLQSIVACRGDTPYLPLIYALFAQAIDSGALRAFAGNTPFRRLIDRLPATCTPSLVAAWIRVFSAAQMYELANAMDGFLEKTQATANASDARRKDTLIAALHAFLQYVVRPRAERHDHYGNVSWRGVVRAAIDYDNIETLRACFEDPLLHPYTLHNDECKQYAYRRAAVYGAPRTVDLLLSRQFSLKEDFWEYVVSVGFRRVSASQPSQQDIVDHVVYFAEKARSLSLPMPPMTADQVVRLIGTLTKKLKSFSPPPSRLRAFFEVVKGHISRAQFVAAVFEHDVPALDIVEPSDDDDDAAKRAFVNEAIRLQRRTIVTACAQRDDWPIDDLRAAIAVFVDDRREMRDAVARLLDRFVARDALPAAKRQKVAD